MGTPRRFYLNLGSNILPEQNLTDAIRLLRDYGDVREISGVWESEAVGSNGPNFLNVSVCFEAELAAAELKSSVVNPIETALGRSRTSDKNSPRTIDIDLLLVESSPVGVGRWAHPFVILPMAELLPDFRHPISGRRLEDESRIAASRVWIRRRPDVILSSR